jgi:7-keto-8-aminopelargonate synthetase-like enzyme
MDGTVDPPRVILETIDEVFPADNANLIIGKAHATRLYVPGGRGMVALLGLVDCVLAQLHTFGNAFAGSGGACLSSYQHVLLDGLVQYPQLCCRRNTFLNYMRLLICANSSTNAIIIASPPPSTALRTARLKGYVFPLSGSFPIPLLT